MRSSIDRGAVHYLPQPALLIRFIGVVAFLLTACDSRPDSQGVGAGGEAESMVEQWTLSDAPELTLSGVASQGDSIHFAGILAARFLDSGAIVLATLSENRIVYLDADGSLLTATGGRGGGPGEFGFLEGLHSADDGLAAWDYPNQRVTWLSDDGEILETASLETPGPHRMAGSLTGGLVVTTPSTAISRTPGANRPYRIWSREGDPLDSIAGPPEVDSPVVQLLASTDGRFSITRTDFEPGCLPDLLDATVADRLYIADSSTGELWSVPAAGDARVIYVAPERGTISEAALDQIELRLARLGQGPVVAPPGATVGRTELVRASVDSLFRKLGTPGSPLLAAWSDMFADSEGRLWLRRATCYSEETEQEWQVISTSGVHVATVTAPSELRLLHANRESVLAVSVDDLDIEHLVVLSLTAKS